LYQKEPDVITQGAQYYSHHVPGHGAASVCQLCIVSAFAASEYVGCMVIALVSHGMFQFPLAMFSQTYGITIGG